jgi:hypothetical protein
MTVGIDSIPVPAFDLLPQFDHFYPSQCRPSIACPQLDLLSVQRHRSRHTRNLAQTMNPNFLRLRVYSSLYGFLLDTTMS